jgi:hypothetical protein
MRCLGFEPPLVSADGGSPPGSMIAQQPPPSPPASCTDSGRPARGFLDLILSRWPGGRGGSWCCPYPCHEGIHNLPLGSWGSSKREGGLLG